MLIPKNGAHVIFLYMEIKNMKNGAFENSENVMSRWDELVLERETVQVVQVIWFHEQDLLDGSHD